MRGNTNNPFEFKLIWNADSGAGDDSNGDSGSGDDTGNDGDQSDNEEVAYGTDAYTHGEIIITIDDVPTTFYLASVDDWTSDSYNLVEISDDSLSFTLDGGGNI